MNNNIKIKHRSCKCTFCKEYSKKGYFKIYGDHKMLKNNGIDIPISSIENNEFRLLFYLHIITYIKNLITTKVYETALNIYIKGEKK